MSGEVRAWGGKGGLWLVKRPGSSRAGGRVEEKGLCEQMKSVLCFLGVSGLPPHGRWSGPALSRGLALLGAWVRGWELGDSSLPSMLSRWPLAAPPLTV